MQPIATASCYLLILYLLPCSFMKDRYVTKLNEHFSSRGIRVDRRHLLFTDWEVDEAGRAFGIEGVEEVCLAN